MRKLTTHPALIARRVTCKKINNIVLSDHGTILVEYEKHVFPGASPDGPSIGMRDCATLSNVISNGKSEANQGVVFIFTQYFTEEERAELHAAFERDEYDYLGDVPEC